MTRTAGAGLGHDREYGEEELGVVTSVLLQGGEELSIRARTGRGKY